MSVMDANWLFGESFDCSLTAGQSTVFTNVIDMGSHLDHKGNAISPAGGNLFQSGKSFLNIVVEDIAFVADADGSVVSFILYEHTSATTPSSGNEIWRHTITVNMDSSETATGRSYVDGTLIVSAPLPARNLERYLGLYVSVATQTLSTGSATAWIGPPAQNNPVPG